MVLYALRNGASKMAKIKVSVILPSFNVREYIAECIESVIHQTMHDIEIICVDAGSTDGTLEILRKYEMEDDRIQVILSDKKSYGYQMNLGIRTARGVYIGIVETDDYIPEKMYEELYGAAKDNDADFVKADFYRFTGAGNQVDKALCKLSDNRNFYNRIIDIEIEQACFYFPINTWSGIYKKEFLQKYNIRHNETPGASYQDTGFWFQTFIYAKRAYFVNRAYYMNRRDNPGSSVYSKEKIFCVSDEFHFILDILRKEEGLWECFKNIYAYTCYQSYKGSLGRIAREYQLIFLRRFSEDFLELGKLGALREGDFHKADWKILCSIMDNPEDFYRSHVLLKECVYEKIAGFEKVILYGAGMVGKSTYHDLADRGLQEKVVCFAVSQKQRNFGNYEEVPIREINELMEYRQDSLVLVTVTTVYQEEIEKKLKSLGFENILPIPE